jgi:hypothetical protein
MLYNVWEEDGQLCFENNQDCLNTLRFAKILAKKGLIDWISWSVATPYPGSQLSELLGTL